MSSAEVIDGRGIAAEVRARVGEEARKLAAAAGVVPGLAVVLVGDDPASEVYVSGKGKAAREAGLHSVQHTLPATTSEADLLKLVDGLNRDPSIHGVLVQFPLPRDLDRRRFRIIEAIDPAKDVDGLHPLNAGRLASGFPDAIAPCTPAGCMVLLRRVSGGELAGRHAVVVGRSNLVGKPVAQLLLAANATVTIAHSRTPDLAATVSGADIVVAAVGRPRMIKGEWIKRGAVVIDVGMNRIAGENAGKDRLVGDVDYAGALQRAAAITPVPGGVGPMTIAMLMANTVAAACRAAGRPVPAF